MLAGDVVQLGLQASQISEFEAFGRAGIMDKGRHLAELGDAWTASYAGRIVACGGFLEQHPHEAVAWIAIAGEIPPAASVSLVRFCRREAASSRYERLEALVDAGLPKALAFVEAIGFSAVATLRKKGADRATQVMFERVR